jgi:hypothetical protein
LRKQFLAHDRKNRTLISNYYIAALFLKYDRESVKLYARSVPHITQALQALLSGREKDIIVTRELRDAIGEIVKHHRDVSNREFQRILNNLEKNLKDWQRKSKDQKS